MMKKALITGICGQDGSYLAEFLLSKNYKVFGLEKSGDKDFGNIRHIAQKIKFVEADLLDEGSLNKAIKKVRPDEIYNLAAQSSVALSWAQPVYTGEITGLSVARLLEAIRQTDPKIKFFQASSSEIFGGTGQVPQNENTPFCPVNPYGNSKLYAHLMVSGYRKAYGMFAVSGILYNHESPRRGIGLVTRKIVNAAVRIKLGMAKELRMGNLNVEKDWGFAGDYVEAMWLMLQQKRPVDYVIATGETHTVKEFVEAVFKYLDLDPKKYVKVDKKFFRPIEANLLKGDYSKAKKELKWKPKIKFDQLVKMMVDSDLKLLQ
jgi:GDPmannose 4,6-dehydratase